MVFLFISFSIVCVCCRQFVIKYSNWKWLNEYFPICIFFGELAKIFTFSSWERTVSVYFVFYATFTTQYVCRNVCRCVKARKMRKTLRTLLLIQVKQPSLEIFDEKPSSRIYIKKRARFWLKFNKDFICFFIIPQRKRKKRVSGGASLPENIIFR